MVIYHCGWKKDVLTQGLGSKVVSVSECFEHEKSLLAKLDGQGKPSRETPSSMRLLRGDGLTWADLPVGSSVAPLANCGSGADLPTSAGNLPWQRREPGPA